MARKLLDDCFLHDKDRLKHDEVLALLSQRLAPVVGTSDVPIPAATGRISSQAHHAARRFPAADNAAVDGFAFDHASYLAKGGQFKVVTRIAAGHPTAVALAPGEAARIFTGAMMPAGADTVAMQEDCRVNGADLTIPGGLNTGANCRLAGEDVGIGDQLIDAGEVIRPADAAALAADGLGMVRAFDRLRIGVISTGDELLPPGATAKDGQQFDSNHSLLAGLAKNLPVSLHHLGIWQDRAETVRQKLASAAADYDLLISTGGASRGEEDHLVEALDSIGHRHVWQLAIKPGRPMCMGQIGDCVFLGLPGNPVAAFVCFLMYVYPTVRRLGGGRFVDPNRLMLPAGFERRTRKTGRREFLRGWLDHRADGPHLMAFDRDGSGLISGLRVAEGLIEISEQVPAVKTGDRLAFIPFDQFGMILR